MNKRIAIITDIHGNLEGLEAILEDIKKQNVDDIICLGDTIDIGPNSKECIDMLIDNDIKMILGNHELYLLRGTDIEPSIEGEEKKHYKWVKSFLTNKEIEYISRCPLFFEYTISYNDKIPDKKILFCHYLICDKNLIQPFERNNLKKDVNLFIKYNDENKIYVIGHLHKYFDFNEVDGISADFIEKTGELPNIEVVESGGCSYDDEVGYTIIDINKNLNIKRIKVKFDREKFIKKILETDFPDKKNILKIFYGINFQ